ncbi:MAG: phytochelatin synthase family protein [Pseudomonadota bacterium]
MNLLRAIIHAYLYLPYFYQKLSGAGPFGHEGATYISTPVSPHDNELKKALLRHYVRQYHESSCSVASVVAVVNALRSRGAEQLPPITQMDILDRVKTGNWKERMGEKGVNGRRGVPLALLGEIVKGSLLAYGIEHESVETVQAFRNPGKAEKIKRTLLQHLTDFDTKGNCLIIAHFNQGVYIPTLGIPHISPVGGFDPRTGKVTLLDVDASELGGPYEISLGAFYRGMASAYNPILRHLGYKNGGYVLVRLR